MNERLDTPAILWLDQTDSTQLEAARRARAGNPLWIAAKRQTAARGQRGRIWHESGHRLSTTLLMFPREPLRLWPRRSLQAGLALLDAIETLTGTNLALQLKWPNDLVVNGKKLAGILLEALPEGGLALGFGVNLSNAPSLSDEDAPRRKATDLRAATGLYINDGTLLEALSESFLQLENCIRNNNFQAIRDRWLERAENLGQYISARSGNILYEGIFYGITEEGNLILKQGAQYKTLASAEL